MSDAKHDQATNKAPAMPAPAAGTWAVQPVAVQPVAVQPGAVRSFVAALPMVGQLPVQPAEFWLRLGLWHDRVVHQQLGDEANVAALVERHGLMMAHALQQWLALPADTQSLPGLSGVLASHIRLHAAHAWAQTLLLLIDLMQNRRYEAVSAAGKLLLPLPVTAAIEATRFTPRGERLAFALQLYSMNPEHLVLLTLYERAERFSFTRQVATLRGDDEAASPQTTPSAASAMRQPITREAVNAALIQFERSRQGGGRSVCLAVLAEAEQAHMVFVRRVLREASIQELDRTLFGDEAELIVLKFAQGFQVLEEHSTRGIGCLIGGAIAGYLLSRPVRYISDDTLTPRAAVRSFLDRMQSAQHMDPLRLVEIHLRQAPLAGSPTLIVRSHYDRSLAETLHALDHHHIRLLGDLDDIRSITLAFAPTGNGDTPHLFKVAFACAGEEIALHYLGAQSSLTLRKRFEGHLKDAYAIAVIPTGI